MHGRPPRSFGEFVFLVGGWTAFLCLIEIVGALRGFPEDPTIRQLIRIFLIAFVALLLLWLWIRGRRGKWRTWGRQLGITKRLLRGRKGNAR